METLVSDQYFIVVRYIVSDNAERDVSVNVSSHETVEHLCARLQQYFKVASIKLVFGNRQLENHEDMERCQIGPDAIVFAISPPAYDDSMSVRPAPEPPELQQITEILHKLHERVSGNENKIIQLHQILQQMQRELQQALKVSAA